MAPMPHPVHPDVLTLADLYLAEWPAARLRIRASGHPTNEGDDDAATDDTAADDADDKSADDAKADASDDAADDAATAKKDDDKINSDDAWKVKARKTEAQRKRIQEERDKLAAKLAEIEKSNMSAQEKAIAKAREDATAEVTTKYEQERRTDRIENAVTKLALKGFKAKDGDKDITLKFADPDDAQLRLDRALRNGDLEYDDIYTDGKAQTDALTDFLTELLTEHPRLRALEPGSNGGKKVDFDAGKGSGSGRKDLESMTSDDHLKEIQGRS